MRKRELYESPISGHVTLLLDPEAVLLCTLAGMSTSLGAALVFLIKVTSHKMRDALVGLSAGIMLSVAVLNLSKKQAGNVQATIWSVSGSWHEGRCRDEREPLLGHRNLRGK